MLGIRPILAPRTSIRPTGAGGLAAAAQAGVQVVVCLFNDRGYGVLREIIRDSYDGYEGAAADVDLATPDFTALSPIRR
ncbi:hypothetical protein GCM10022419_071520 [Nonomuraea rosea]|uniref:Thiamine pyrophosphate enzyme TPP-binding domain-containing protein n=1 Tax=Nonomuraea rosea TaxID=638574 RepID=A0ABP6Y9X7_9ACTN